MNGIRIFVRTEKEVEISLEQADAITINRLRARLSNTDAEGVNAQGDLYHDIKYHTWDRVALDKATDLDKAIFRVIECIEDM